ncbi:uncharacterized protein [Asterias amurensis]|uniref:uncharacterized protein n=1 Tax=Asterias amurensis TaxID=7602 RepID=UPI003AB61A25
MWSSTKDRTRSWEHRMIRFGGMHRFSGVMMQTGFNSSESALSYELSYSEDGLEWFNYDQVFENDFNYTENVTSSLNIIPLPFNGAFLRIRPQSYPENTSFPLMRFELLGCRRSVTIDLAAACQTTDFPDIDNNVASIIALEPDTMELFGVSQNRRAIMRSGDLGVTWSSMEPERYLDLSSKGYLMEMSRVPFVEVSDVPDIVMATEGNNAFFEWGAATEGLYRREVSSVDVNATSAWELIGTWGFP